MNRRRFVESLTALFLGANSGLWGRTRFLNNEASATARGATPRLLPVPDLSTVSALRSLRLAGEWKFAAAPQPEFLEAEPRYRRMVLSRNAQRVFHTGPFPSRTTWNIPADERFASPPISVTSESSFALTASTVIPESGSTASISAITMADSPPGIARSPIT